MYSVLNFIIDAFLSLGIIKISLLLNDTRKADYASLFLQGKKLINFIVASILYGLIVLAGLILLIVPGLIWAFKYSFYAYFIVDENAGPIESLKKSSRLTKGAIIKLMFFGLAQAGVFILGVLALVVGLLWAYPVVGIAEAHVYRKLLSQMKPAETAKAQ